MKNAIEINNLCKSYTDFTLDNVSFAVPEGSIMGFIGENGAGKTTTILSMLNIIQPSHGEVQILGLSPYQDALRVNAQIGVVMEDCFFYAGLRVSDISPIMRGIYQNWDEREFTDMLRRFSLPEKKFIREYSRGMKMKLQLAAALAHKPKLLILDEATSGLDPVVRSEMLDLFMEFIQDEQHSILLSSHITADLEKVADYITFIHQGKIVFTRNKDDIMQSYAVVKCTESDLAALDKTVLAGVRRSHFGCEALINNRQEVQRRFPHLLVDSVSLDDIMTFIAKEGCTC